MIREPLDAKALRYIREGRLRVVLVDGEQIEARVRGSDAEHVVGYRRGGWWCDCPGAPVRAQVQPPSRTPTRDHSAKRLFDRAVKEAPMASAGICKTPSGRSERQWLR